jgi:hypothetical protein
MSPHRFGARAIGVVSVAVLCTACGGTSPTSRDTVTLDKVPGHIGPAAPSAGSLPTWLPPGVQQIAGEGEQNRLATYSLPGRANAAVTVPGDSREAAAASHPQTGLLLTSGPKGSLTTPLIDPLLHVAKPVQIRSRTGLLVEQANGLGEVVLAWTAGAYDYQLFTVRLSTPDGVSGLPSDTLVEIAASVPG